MLGTSSRHAAQLLRTAQWPFLADSSCVSRLLGPALHVRGLTSSGDAKDTHGVPYEQLSVGELPVRPNQSFCIDVLLPPDRAAEQRIVPGSYYQCLSKRVQQRCRMSRLTFSFSAGVPKETFQGEARVSLTPAGAAALRKAGFGSVVVEADAGAAARFAVSLHAPSAQHMLYTKFPLFAAAVHEDRGHQQL